MRAKKKTSKLKKKNRELCTSLKDVLQQSGEFAEQAQRVAIEGKTVY
jgi:prefoldin subunit 5